MAREEHFPADDVSSTPKLSMSIALVTVRIPQPPISLEPISKITEISPGHSDKPGPSQTAFGFACL